MTQHHLVALRQSSLSGIPAPLWARTLEDGSDVRVYQQPNRPDRTYMIAFAGRAGRPASHYSYRTQAQAQAAAEDFIASRSRHAAYMTTRKAERQAFTSTLTPGRVLMEMWGYDQTNINYYQVISVSASGRSCVIREIGAKSVEDGPWMQGHCWPLADHFIGEPMTKRIGQGDSIKVRDWGSYAHPWTPKADRWTAYA